MKKLASKLIDYGIEFTYEHNGSNGEKIESFELDCRISIQQGRIWFTHCGAVEEMEESDKSINYLVARLDEIAIEETN